MPVFRINRSAAGLVFVTMLVFMFSSGCLAIGGRQVTYNCEGGKHAEQQVAQLEDRIKVLEQYAGIAPQTSTEQQVAVAALTVEQQDYQPIDPSPIR